MANFAGVRIRPVDLAEERQRRLEGLVYDARDIHADMRRYQRSKWITAEEREDALADQAAKLRELVKESAELRALVLPGAGRAGGTDPVARRRWLAYRAMLASRLSCRDRAPSAPR